ncbi:MAG TPA: hypothetical protein VF547_07565 [Allosphingosinicella sp.]|jgi:hypothetical protein
MDLVRVATGMAVLLASGAPAAAAPRKDQDPDRQICKSKPVIGSRLKRVRECHSAAEWEDLKLAEQIGLGRQQFNGADGLGARESYLPPGAAAQQPN